MAKPIKPGIGSDSASEKAPNFNENAAVVSNDNAGDIVPSKPSIFDKMATRAAERKEVSMSLTEWAEKSKDDPSLYMTPAENILRAIGKPEEIDTARLDPQTRRIFNSATIERYAPFNKFFDAEKTISHLVAFLRAGAEGMLVLNGPVGSGKTEIAETLEKLTEMQPVSVLRCKVTGQISPFLDSPLCLMADESLREAAINEYGIHENYLKGMIKSPWVTKRMDFHSGNPEAAFEVVRVTPSRERQFGIGKYDPQNKDNPDFSALIGRVDMNKVGDPDPLYKNHPDPKMRGKTLSENDPDAYIPGLLSNSNGGFLHLAEFLRNNPAMMNVFLEGVTTGYFVGAGNIGMLPMRQVICMTSNGPVLDEFRSAKESDAARNRIEEIKVGYTLRMSEELNIYKKFLKVDNLERFPMAPKTLDLLAEFSIAARVKDGIGGALKAYDPFIRVKVLNGEKAEGGKVPTLEELRAKASPDEGMSGFSVRDAKRTMKMAFEMRSSSGIREADTITMLEALRTRLSRIDINDISEAEKVRLGALITKMEENNRKEMDKIVKAAVMSADEPTCQRIFDEYMDYARAWIDDSSIHSSTGEPIDKARVVKHLEAFEKRAGITNGPDFRKTAVAYVNAMERQIGNSNFGKEVKDQVNPKLRWDAYQPVEKCIRAQFEVDSQSRMQILRAQSAEALNTPEEKRQYTVFHENMRSKGYTDTMVSRMLHHLQYT